VAELLPPGKLLVTGAIRLEEPLPGNGAAARRRVYNSILALDDEGRLAAFYDKLHLVPFGEYLPFQRWLEAIGLEQLTRVRGGFDAGRDASRSLAVPGLPPASPLVCYEAIFPDGVTARGGARPSLLLNVTNDGWFGSTAGPHQHFHQARVRAIEQGLPLVRAANTGISAVVDGHGRVLARLPLGRQGVIDSPLPQALRPTLYSRFGDAGLLAMLLAGLGWWYALTRTRGPSSRAA
jgi:apolipoprotein N-acyltransferase